MSRALSVLSAVLLLLAAAGCQKIRDEYTLNPDGSGKVTVRRLAPMAITMAGAPKNLVPEDEARKAAAKLVEKSAGVEVWKDVTWKVEPDGRILVRGTAYFRDLNKVDLGESGRLSLEKPAGGGMVLTLAKGGRSSRGGAEPAETAPAKLEGKELEQAILREKMKWQQGRGMLVAMLHGMEMETVVNLPGKVAESFCFKPGGGGKSASLKLKGDDFLKVLDSLTDSEEFWKKQAAGGRGSLDDLEVPEVLEKLFGSKEPPRLTVKQSDKTLFDYAKEAAAAQAAYAELRKKLGAGSGGPGPGSEPAPVEIAPAPEGAGMGKVWVVEVVNRLKPDVPADKDFMFSNPCCQVELVGEMPGAVVKVEDGDLEKAVAADGTDVLSKQQFWRKTRSARLAGKNKDLVQFAVTLELLPDGVSVLKELAGSLTYTVGSGSKKVDLGEIELKKGATGAALGATVKNFNKSFKSFEIETDLESPELVKGFSFKTPEGADVAVSLSGSSTWNKKATFRFRFSQDVAEKVKAEAELYEKTEKRKLPFKLENLKLR